MAVKPSNTAPQKTAPKVPFNTDDLDDADIGEDFDGALPPLPAAFGGKPLIDVATGFPPYFEPTKGAVVDLIPKMLDFADPKFLRVICQYVGNDPLTCYTGPKGEEGESATEVIVQPGDLFTFGWYASLPLEYALKHGTAVRVICMKRTINGKTEEGEPKKLWHWKYQCTEVGAKDIMSEKNRAMGFGIRNPKKNPMYLLAFTTNGLNLSAPTTEMLALGESVRAKAAERTAATAEA